MNFIKNKLLKIYIPGILVALSCASPLVFAAAESPQSFTYQGALTNAAGTAPLADVVGMTIGIYSKLDNCLLYEESQSSDLTSTAGLFSIQVGAGTRTANDPGKTFAQVFANTSTPLIAAGGAHCTTGYTPMPGDVRYIRFTITPQSTGVSNVLSPDQVLASVPQANVAETLQGMGPTSFLQVEPSTNLSQASLEVLTGSAGTVVDASSLHNHDSLYVKLGTASGTQSLGPIAITNSASTTAVTVTGASGQTSDLLDVNSSGGASYFSIDKTGNVALGASETLGLGSFSADPVGMSAADAGKIWYENGQIHYWNGTAVATLDSSTGTSFLSLAGGTLTGTLNGTNLSLSGSTSIGGNIAVTGSSTFTGNVTMSGNLGVTGVSTFAAGTSNAPGVQFTNSNGGGLWFNSGLQSLVLQGPNNQGALSVGQYAVNSNEAIVVSGNQSSSTGAILASNSWLTGTGTTAHPNLLLEPNGTTSTTWNANGTGLAVDAVSGFTGNLIDLQTNGTSQFKVDAAGNLTATKFYGDGSNLTNIPANAINLGAPGAIGATTASSGAFTTLTSSGLATFNSASVTGSLGVGTNNPGYTLDVNGNANVASGSSYLIGGTAMVKRAGASNLAFGLSTWGTPTGQNNLSLGDLAGGFTSGYDNTAAGTYSQASVTTGAGNTSLGSHSLQVDVSGSHNTAIGQGSLPITTGSGNVALGAQAGSYETGSNSFYVNNGVDETNTANEKSYSLLYGQFSGTAGSLVNQQLTVNGALHVNGAVNATSFSGDGSALTNIPSSAVNLSAPGAIGATTASSGAFTTLSSSGLATLNSSSITGNESIGGTLGVTGVSTLGTVNATAVTASNLSATGHLAVSDSVGTGGQLVSVLAPNITGTGNAVSMGFGQALTTGNSVFLAWWGTANPYGSFETYGGSAPNQMKGSQIWLNGGPVFVGNANANGGATLPTASGLFHVGSTNQFYVDSSGNVNTSGTVTATKFYGDGSNLTNIPSSAVNLSAPGAIGATTASTGAFTSLSASGNETVGGTLAVSGTGNSSFIGNVGIGTSGPNAKLDINSGGSTDIYMGVDSGATNYNTISLNGNLSDSGSLGFTGGGNGDKTLYIDAPIGGKVIVRPNGNGSDPGVFDVTSNGNVGIGAITPVSKLQVSGTPTATPFNGLVSVGEGPFDGTTAGFFNGSTSGTELAVNSSSTFAGDLINLEKAGTSKFKVDNTGAVTATSFSGSGANLTGIPSTAVDWTKPGTIGSTTPSTAAFTSADVSGTLTAFTFANRTSGNAIAPVFATSSGTGTSFGLGQNSAQLALNATYSAQTATNPSSIGIYVGDNTALPNAANSASNSLGYITSTGFSMRSGTSFGFSSSNTNAGTSFSARSLLTDTQISRTAAGTLSVDTGTIGNSAGTLIAGNIGIGTTAPASKLQVSATPAATPFNGLVSVGDGAFDGTTSGFFNGSANGTDIAVNTGAAFTGDLINLEKAGTSKFKVDNTGAVTATKFYGDGSNLTNIPASAVNLSAPGAIGATTASTGAFTTLSSSGNETVGGALTVSGTGNSSFVGNVGIGLTNPTHALVVKATADTGEGMLVTTKDGWGSGEDVALYLGDTGHYIKGVYSSSDVWYSYYGQQFNNTSGSVMTVGYGAGSNIGIGTTTPVSKLQVAGTPGASSNFGLVSFGDGAFDGSSSGKFTGSSSGTELAVNSASGFTGNLIDLQTGGVSKFSVSAAGVITGSGAGLTSVPSSAVSWAAPGTIGSTTPNTGAFTTLAASGTTTLNGAVVASAAPVASATTATVNVGSTLSGGNSNGTYVAVNTASGYTGDLENIQMNGTSVWKVPSSAQTGATLTAGRAIASVSSSTITTDPGNSSFTVDFSKSNVQVIKFDTSSALGTDVYIALTNLVSGGAYTLKIDNSANTTTPTFHFNTAGNSSSQCTTTNFVPSNGATTASSRSIYSILYTVEGSASVCDLSWMTGFVAGN